MYDQLAAKNTHFPLYPVTHDSFRQYGRIVDEYDFSEWIHVMEDIAVPAENNIYAADDPKLSSGALAKQIQAELYAGLPIQVGYCNGNGNKLNAFEYHKTQELNVAVTDMILLLSDIREIKDNKLEVSTVKGYYLPANCACELHGTTLHFAPCKVSDQGFKCIVVLPQGTNTPLEAPLKDATGESQLLWMKGKWLIAHPESVPASKGACAGILGDNIQVLY